MTTECVNIPWSWTDYVGVESVADRICSIAGCQRKHAARGYCDFHLLRLRRGISFDQPMREIGTEFCTVEGCQRKHLAKGLCSLHYQRQQKGKPLDSRIKGINAPPETYKQAHDLVYRVRGKASDSDCVDCGSVAEEWSYQGGCPREKVELVRGEFWLAYSPDPFMYRPRCIRCHRAKDLGSR